MGSDASKLINMFGRKNKEKKILTKRMNKEGVKTALGSFLDQAIKGIVDAIPLVRSTATAIKAADDANAKFPWVRLGVAGIAALTLISGVWLLSKGLITFDQMFQLIQSLK